MRQREPQKPRPKTHIRPILGLPLGLALGILLAIHAGWGLAWAWVWLWAVGLGLFWALRDLAQDRYGVAAWVLLSLGLGLGVYTGQGLARDLAQEAEFYCDACQLKGRVREDLGGRVAAQGLSGRAAVLEDVSYLNLLSSSQVWQVWPGRVRLNYLVAADTQPFAPGQGIEWVGRLRSPRPPGNPGEFDYRSFLIGRGITALASVRFGGFVNAMGEPQLSWRNLAWRLRQRLLEALDRALPPRAAALAQGMVLGDTDGLNAHDFAAYARTGLVHILSVSGLHLVFAVAIFVWIAKRLGLRRRRQAWLALSLGTAYAMVCGMPVPCQRALALFALFFVAQALDYDADALTSLAFGAALILIVQPGALFEAGGQLSFAASLALVTLTTRIETGLQWVRPELLRRAWAATLAAEAATLPLVLWHFNMLCWPSLIASWVSAPLMAPIVGLGLGVACLGALVPWAAVWLAWPLKVCLLSLDWLSLTMAQWPHASFSAGHPSAGWLLAWLFALVLVAWRGKRWLASLVLLLIWAVWPGLPWAHRHPGQTKVWFFDVGQGDACLLEFGDGRTLLVDAGPALPDAGSWVLAPAFRHLGIQKIDLAVVSHPHADHSGGLLWLLEEFDLRGLLHSGQKAENKTWPQVLQAAARHATPVLDLSLGQEPLAQTWPELRWLPTTKIKLAKSARAVHDRGTVLEVGGWLLLPGDLERSGEAALRKLGQWRKIELLKVGHHGSNTSTSPAFLKTIRPRHALISCAWRNRYNHPSPKILKRLEGRTLWRTDLQGCVYFEKDEKGLRAKPWREAKPSELFAPPPQRPAQIWKRLEKLGLIETVSAGGTRPGAGLGVLERTAQTGDGSLE